MLSMDIVENNPFKILDHCFEDLKNFSDIGPNSWIRLSNTTGHFIITGGVWGNIPGMQSMAATYRGEADPDQVMIANFKQFTHKITTAVLNIFSIGSATEDEEVKKKCFLMLVEAQQRFIYALKGKAKNPEGGLNGILKTYAIKKEIHQALEENISLIQSAVSKTFHNSRDWFQVEGKMCLDWSKEWGSEVKAEQAHADPSLLKYYANYTVPLAYNQARYYLPNSEWRPWDVIYTDDNGCALVLGGLPSIIHTLSGDTVRDDLKDFQTAGIKSILSVVEHFEMCSPGWVIDPISPEVWKENDIHQLELAVPDFGTTCLATIEKGVDFIHSEMDQGRSVYAHCKAGRGRSYMLTLCYLIKYGNLSLLQAMELVKAKRPQVNLESGDEKMESLHQFAYIYDPSFEYDPKFKLSTANAEGEAADEGFALLEVKMDPTEDQSEDANLIPQGPSGNPPSENCIVS